MSTNTSHLLLPDTAPDVLSNQIDNEIDNYFELDRYLGDAIILPYTFDEIRIKSNELCVSDNLNASLYKLYHNFLYLNSQTKVASNNFPATYKGYVASDATASNTLQWYLSTNNTTVPSGSASDVLSTTKTILSGLVDGVFAKSLGTDTTYVGFVVNDTTIIPIQSNNTDTSAKLRLGDNAIDGNGWRYLEAATSLAFTDIKSIDINSENDLFVCDATNIYKLDVNAILTHNSAISAVGRYLINTIGGNGKDIHDKIKFGTPTSMRIGKNDNVYVLDSEHKGYKIYDRDLNWISTASKGQTEFNTLTGNLVDMAVSILDESVYILVDDGTVFEYNKDSQLTKKHTLRDTLASGEKYKRLIFSKVDPNILYVLTSYNIYKKFKTKISKSIGAFRLSDVNISDEHFAFIDVYNEPGSLYDFVFIGSHSISSPEIGKIFKFNERVTYQTIIYDSYKTQLYSLSSVLVDGDEYVTSWITNKSVHKLLYNHLILRDNFHSRYVGRYDSQGRIQYNGVHYITDSDANLFNYNIPANCTIGVNEPMLAETTNRSLKELYDIQLTLLDMCREKYSNKYPAANQVVVL